MPAGLHFERVYRHPINEVWFALTDSAALDKWLAANDFEPTVGRAFTFRDEAAPNRSFTGTVGTVEPPDRLVYTFETVTLRQPTTVTFTLTPTDDGTRLVLEQTGFRGLADVAARWGLRWWWRRRLNDLGGVLVVLVKTRSRAANRK